MDVVVAGNRTAVLVYDWETGQKVRDFPGHSETTWGAAVSRNGKYVATCGNDGLVKLWSLPDGKPVRSLITSSTAARTSAGREESAAASITATGVGTIPMAGPTVAPLVAEWAVGRTGASMTEAGGSGMAWRTAGTAPR